MTTDLTTRLIAGPGSRELDAEVFLITNQDFKLVKNSLGKAVVIKNGHRWFLDDIVPNLTTSIDAAVAFAVAMVGAERARYLVSRTVYIQWSEDEDDQTALDALPRYIVAEVLKARGDER